MIIYKMTHIPSGKFYIGSLQRSNLWHRYKTSSKVVRSMILKNPELWIKEILKQYPKDYDPQLLVDEEYSLIDDAVKRVGWDGIWNLRGSTNLGSSGYSPEAREKQRASAKDPSVIARAKLSKKAFIDGNPDYFDRISATAKSTWNQPQMREYASKRAIQQFANQDNRKLASDIKKAHLAKHPEDIAKSLEGMKKARQSPVKEDSRVQKIKNTMSAKSEIFSQREIIKHASNPALGRQHGQRLKALNQSDPSRKKRMSDSAKKKIQARPDLVAKSVEKMNSAESRAKMKASLLAKYGKWVLITFADGEKIKIFGAKEAGRILGIDNISRKATQESFRKPVICTSVDYSGREVISVRYLDT